MSGMIVTPSRSRRSHVLVSGRIDVLELRRCADVSFWTEIVENGILLERRQFQEQESTLLGAVATWSRCAAKRLSSSAAT
jgi:hypothetical protein